MKTLIIMYDTMGARDHFLEENENELKNYSLIFVNSPDVTGVRVTFAPMECNCT